MITLVIFAAICFLLAQIKADTSTVRMILGILGVLLWVLSVAHLVTLPVWLTR